MSRWCAFLNNEPANAAAPADHVRAVGGVPITITGPHALGLLDGPGVADGPFTAGDLTAVGEVTLFDADRLRARLGADAPPPHTPDGELLLRVYARFGLDGIAAAEGMFALAVIDGPDLVLLRDHVGSRTLFHAKSPAGWAASTSLRALRHWPALRTGLHLPAVRSFLTFAYLPGRETLLRDVHEVLPGRCVRLHPDGTYTEHTYWEPRECTGGRPARDRTAAEHTHTLRELLEQAVARRLPAGDSVGVLLSGGIDSSLVTALAAKLHDHPVHTYSIGFGADAPNELGYSGLVATHCGTRHRVLTVPAATVADRLADTVGLLDSPVGDPLTVPNLMLAEAVAADGLAVVLNGEGGDPVFGGPKNLPMLIFEMFREDPHPDARARAYLDSYRKCYADLPALLTPQALDALADAPSPAEHVAPYLRPGRMSSLLNQLLHTNLRTKGAHHILTKVERLTAASGIEGRAPLFDRAVVDHAFAVPPTLKLAGDTEKWILKQAVRDLLPDTVVDRPKSGMRVPVQQWLDGPLRDLTDEVLLGRTARARGLFRQDTLRAWARGEGSLLPRQGGKLWLVLSLELWLRSYDLTA